MERARSVRLRRQGSGRSSQAGTAVSYHILAKIAMILDFGDLYAAGVVGSLLPVLNSASGLDTYITYYDHFRATDCSFTLLEGDVSTFAMGIHTPRSPASQGKSAISLVVALRRPSFVFSGYHRWDDIGG